MEAINFIQNNNNNYLQEDNNIDVEDENKFNIIINKLRVLKNGSVIIYSYD
jgi:hypothetical protein